MIFDIENWLWKSELFNLHSQIQNRALICQRPFKVKKCLFPCLVHLLRSRFHFKIVIEWNSLNSYLHVLLRNIDTDLLCKGQTFQKSSSESDSSEVKLSVSSSEMYSSSQDATKSSILLSPSHGLKKGFNSKHPSRNKFSLIFNI